MKHGYACGALIVLAILSACQQKAAAPVATGQSLSASSQAPSPDAAMSPDEAMSAGSASASNSTSSKALSDAGPEAIGPLGQAAGLWKLTQTRPQTEGAHIAKICVNAEQGQRLAMIGQDLFGGSRLSGLSCTRRGVVRRDGSAEADTVCTLNRVRMTSHIHADIIGHKLFHQTVETRYDPAFAGRGDQITVTDASWQGPCPSGMRPGDFIDRDGVHANMAAVLDKFR